MTFARRARRRRGLSRRPVETRDEDGMTHPRPTRAACRPWKYSEEDLARQRYVSFSARGVASHRADASGGTMGRATGRGESGQVMLTAHLAPAPTPRGPPRSAASTSMRPEATACRAPGHVGTIEARAARLRRVYTTHGTSWPRSSLALCSLTAPELGAVRDVDSKCSLSSGVLPALVSGASARAVLPELRARGPSSSSEARARASRRPDRKDQAACLCPFSAVDLYGHGRPESVEVFFEKTSTLSIWHTDRA